MMDLSAMHLAERVDGAELRLRALGCQRLRVWPIAAPAGELEILSFATKAGAATRLTEETANQRSPTSPGDEGYVGANVVLFRRGTEFVRLIADRSESPESLLAVARRIDAALARGEVSP
jgi:hypothetical protein